MAYVLLLAVLALGVPLAANLNARVGAEVRTQAQAQADLVAATAADLLAPARRRELGALVQNAAISLRGRVLIVNATGGVLVDSAGPAQIGSSYESRPEILAALGGRQIQVQRVSKTLGQEILATAVPMIRNGRPVGAVRVTQSVAAVGRAVRNSELGLGLIALIVLALGSSAAALIAAQVARPLGRLERVARQVAAGDLSARAQVEGSSEQRSLGRSFNEMTDRIVRLLNVQREFVADASHHLRTPLTGLRLRLEAAQAVGDNPASAAELDAALAEVDRLAHTVGELLVLSRAGEREPAGAKLDLADVVSTASERWQAAADTRGILLEHEPGAQRAVAWAARPDVERALDALLENALNYSPPGSTITIVSRPGHIEVRDRGPGLAAGEHEVVFERFHRGQASIGGPAGDGLGLAIARELTREWRGNVVIEDRAGGGSVAVVSLPTGPP
ncbi:MAG TPA: ATP-binding protein [Solirubrobacteraceae bacterium]|nr:ATP-binding protein [Solirubrobacteraceae bacterium]